MINSTFKKALNILFLQIFLFGQISTASKATWLTLSAVGALTTIHSSYLFADAFDDAAAEGQNDAASLLREFGMDTRNGQMSFKNPDGSISTEGLNQFFPSSGSYDDTTEINNANGSGSALGSATEDINARLDSEASAQGEAYRTIKNVINSSSHANRKTDPVFNTAKAILDDDDPAYDMVLRGCTPVTTNQSPHVPSYQNCNIYEKKKSICQVSHQIDSPVFKVLGGGANIGSCGANCIEITVGNTTDGDASASPAGVCQEKRKLVSLQVSNPNAITGAVLTNVAYKGHAEIEIENAVVWTGSEGYISNPTSIPDNDASCQSGSAHDDTVSIDITSSIKKTGLVSLNLKNTLNDTAYTQATIQVHFDASVALVDEWTPEECIEIANSNSTAYCSINTLCLAGPDENGCITTENGREICAGSPEFASLQDSPISTVSRLCQLVEVTRDCDFTSGMATNWTNALGANRSIGDGLPTLSTCGAYETNSSCAFSQSDCIPGASDVDGTCYGKEVVYDCGYTAAPLASTSCTTDAGGAPIFDTAFTGCTTTTDTQEVTTTNRIPDLKTCETLVQPANKTCTATRDLDVRVDAGIVQVGVIGYNINTFRFDMKNGTYQMIPQSDRISMRAGNNYGNIPTIDFDEVCGEGSASIELTSIKPWVPPLPNDLDGGNTPVMVQAPSCANNLIGIVKLTDTNGLGDIDLYGGEFTFYYKQVLKDEWVFEDQECETTATQILDGYCNDGAVSCTLHNQSCVVENGVSVCAPDIKNSLYAGIGAGCLSMEITNNGCQFNSGNLSCWTDPQGVEHCPTNESNFTDTCGVLSSDTSCIYIDEQCIDGSEGPSGTCYAFTRLYDCGEDIPITNIISTTSTTCDGAIRCMGGDCITRTSETNPDFGKAAATMAAADFMAMETSCATEGNAATCEMFIGDDYECKKALGGYVDCCETPSGVSLTDYMMLARNTYELAEQTGAIDSLVMSYQNTAGAWTKQITGSVTDIYSEATAPINSAYESLISEASKSTLGELFASGGGTGEVYDQVIGTFGPAALKQQAAQYGGTFLAETFGPEVATSLLETTVGPIQPGSSLQFTGNLATSGAGALLGAIMFAYMIYSIVNILIQIIWACEEEEFELGVKRELKSCHYVGSYCADEILGSCIEKREAYCCYSSPFGRIVQEQGKAQLGMNFGTAEAPLCEGLSVAVIEQLDWDQIDLSEWVAILQETGQIPTVNDALTDYQINAATGTTALQDAGQEIQELIDITDQEGTSDNVRDRLWGN